MNDPTKSRYRYIQFKSSNIYRRFNSEEKNLKKGSLDIHLEDIPAHGTYGSLLFRPEWKIKRQQIINRDKYCILCRETKSLQVHHRQYHFVVRENKFKLPWEYSDHLLITLCENCHRKGHSKYKVPTINI